MTEPLISISLSEYNRLKDIAEAFTKKQLYVECQSYFTGGPGGVIKNGVVIFCKDGSHQQILDLIDVQEEIYRQRTAVFKELNELRS